MAENHQYKPYVEGSEFRQLERDHIILINWIRNNRPILHKFTYENKSCFKFKISLVGFK